MSIGTFHSSVNVFLSCGAALELIASLWFCMLMLHFTERTGPSLCTRLHLFSSSALLEGRLVGFQLCVHEYRQVCSKCSDVYLTFRVVQRMIVFRSGLLHVRAGPSRAFIGS